MQHTPMPAKSDPIATEPESESVPAVKRAIKKHRRSAAKVAPVFPRASVARLVRSIANDIKSNLLWQPDAIAALHEAGEELLLQRFDQANRLARLCKVETLTPAHFRAAVST